MSDHIENSNKVRESIMPVLNALVSRHEIPVLDINAALLGMVTCSMEAEMGKKQARDFINSSMDNVWGKPEKSFWKKSISIVDYIKSNLSKGDL